MLLTARRFRLKNLYLRTPHALHVAVDAKVYLLRSCIASRSRASLVMSVVLETDIPLEKRLPKASPGRKFRATCVLSNIHALAE